MKIVKVPSEPTPEEKEIHEKLRQIRLAYERQAQPYIDRLIAIENTKVPNYQCLVEPGEMERIHKYMGSDERLEIKQQPHQPQ